MIASHRRRHRIVWLLLAAAIPLLLWLAVAARPEWPVEPAASARELAPFAEKAP